MRHGLHGLGDAGDALDQVFQFFADGIAATVLLAYGNEDSLVDLGCRGGGRGEDTEGVC